MSARPSRGSAAIIAVAIVVAAALFSPVGAVAAGQLVEISSVSGRKADVTRAEQLQTAEASPHQFIRGFGGTTGGCSTVLTAPSTKAVVVKTIAVDFYSVPTVGYVYLYLGTPTNCPDSFLTAVDTEAVGVTMLDLGPGIAIPAGGRLTVAAANVYAFVTAFGYKVPSEAVPATVADVSAPARPAE